MWAAFALSTWGSRLRGWNRVWLRWRFMSTPFTAVKLWEISLSTYIFLAWFQPAEKPASSLKTFWLKCQTMTKSALFGLSFTFFFSPAVNISAVPCGFLGKEQLFRIKSHSLFSHQQEEQGKVWRAVRREKERRGAESDFLSLTLRNVDFYQLLFCSAAFLTPYLSRQEFDPRTVPHSNSLCFYCWWIRGGGFFLRIGSWSSREGSSLWRTWTSLIYPIENTLARNSQVLQRTTCTVCVHWYRIILRFFFITNEFLW